MKKILLVMVAILAVSYGCTKSVELSTPLKNSLSKSEALEVIKNSISDNYKEKGYEFYKFIESLDNNKLIFIWKNNSNEKYYVRYVEAYGKAFKVNVSGDEGGKKTEVSLKSNSIINHCFGFTSKIPVVTPDSLKVYWDGTERYGCKSNFIIDFNDRKKGMLFASALEKIFVLDSEEKTAKPASAVPITAPLTGGNKEKCSVDKILKMQEIGLSKDEIKKVCE